jgi:MFS family permease
MIKPIKHDFGLSNFEVGLLHETTFALFYTFFGLRLGRLADTRSRRGLIAWGFVLWSLMTAASGLARRFSHLLLCRTGVAVGEASLSPAAYSLITDYFPPHCRATAIGVYSFGVCLGSGLSLVCLGLLISFLKSAELPVLPLVGTVVGLIVALGGALGAAGGGRLADALRGRGRADANMLVALLGAVLMAVAAAAYPLAGSGARSAVWLAPLVVGFSAPFGVVAATVQELAPAPMRAQASALFLFVVNLLGLGLGPLAAGWLGDRHPSGSEAEWPPQVLLVTLLVGSMDAVVAFALGPKPYRQTVAEIANEHSPT